MKYIKKAKHGRSVFRIEVMGDHSKTISIDTNMSTKEEVLAWITDLFSSVTVTKTLGVMDSSTAIRVVVYLACTPRIGGKWTTLYNLTVEEAFSYICEALK